MSSSNIVANVVPVLNLVGMVWHMPSRSPAHFFVFVFLVAAAAHALFYGTVFAPISYGSIYEASFGPDAGSTKHRKYIFALNLARKPNHSPTPGPRLKPTP